VFGDPQPAGDICDTRDTSTSVDPNNRNIGDLLNAKGVTWGWFNGGFRDCLQMHANKAGVVSKDYIPHHQPFQFFKSTQNLAHTPPSSVWEIGHDGSANHQYDLIDFWAAVDAGNMPAVSFLKAPAYQDGHAGYSDPLDEQEFLVETINRLERTRFWKDTAVVILYDDSDGWYDHQMGPIVNQSQDLEHDALTATGCGARRCAAHAGRVPDPLRVRTAAAAAGRLAFGEDELRRPHHHRSILGPPLHRGQLADGAHRELFVRQQGRVAPQPACVRSTRGRGRTQQAVPRSEDGPALERMTQTCHWG
jgi:hypothetical protein